MLTRQQNSVSVSNLLSVLSKLIRWALNNPLQAITAMLAMQLALASAKKGSRQPRPVQPEVRDISETLQSKMASFETRDLSHRFAVNDVTQAYRSRQLEDAACKTGVVPNEAWAIMLGGADFDYGYDVAIDAEDQIYILGYTKSYGAGNNDVLLSRFNPDGSLQWSKTLGAAEDDLGFGLSLRSDEEILVTGYTKSQGAEGTDVLLAQFYSNGTLGWAKTFGGAANEYGYEIALRPNGKILLTGYTNSAGAGADDAFLAQCDFEGNLEWASTLGGGYTDYAYSLALLADGKAIITGTTYSLGAGDSDILLAQFDIDGSLDWAKVLGTAGNDNSYAVAVKSDGRVLFTGSTATAFSFKNTLLAQLYPNGTLEWAKALGNIQQNGGYNLILRPDGRAVVSGFAYGFGKGSQDVLLAQFDPSGTLEWAKSLGGASFDAANSLALSSDDKIVIAGFTNSFGNDYEMFLAKFSDDIDMPMLASNAQLTHIANNSYVQFNMTGLVSDRNWTSMISEAVADNFTQSLFVPANFSNMAMPQVRPLSLMLNVSAFSTPADSIISFQFDYVLPTPAFMYMPIQPGIRVDTDNLDWLNYDTTQKRLSGVPLDTALGQQSINLLSDTVVLPSVGALYGQIQMDICITSGLSRNDGGIKIFGGEGEDTSFGGSPVVIGPDGQIVLAGYTSSYGAGSYDAFLAQFDSDSSLQWAVTLGGEGYDGGSSISIRPDGRIVLTGYAEGLGEGSWDFLLAQFSPNGTLEWAKIFGGPGDDDGYAIALHTDGRIVVAGCSVSFDSGSYDVLLAQFYPDGALDWARVYGGQGEDQSYALVISLEGHISVAGYSNSFGAGLYDAFLVQFDSAGKLLWAKTLGGGNDERATSLAIGTDNRIILAGYTYSFGVSNQEVLLAQFYSNGTLDWARTFGGTYHDAAFGVAVSPLGKIVLTGWTSSFGVSDYDVLLGQIDSNGTLEWMKSIGAENSESAFGIAIRPNGRLIILADTTTFGAGSVDIMLTQLSPAGELEQANTLVRPILNVQALTVSPNITDIGQLAGTIEVNANATLLSISPGFISPLVDSPFPEDYFQLMLPPVQQVPYGQFYQLDLKQYLYSSTSILRINELNKALLPAWLSYDGTKKILSGQPSGSVRGKYQVDMLLMHLGEQQQVNFIINVPNTPPYYMGNTTLNAPVGRFIFHLGNSFQDNENDRCFPFGVGLLNGELPQTIASIDPISGRLFGTTLSGDQGSYQFNITATDPYGSLGWQLITLNILNTSPRLQYVFSNPAPVATGSLFSYDFPANAFGDQDGDPLVYTALNTPSFLSFYPGSRILSGRPSAADRGNYTVSFTAEDPYGGSSRATINITVINSAPLPVDRIFDQQVSATESAFSFVVPAFMDPDGDTFSYAARMHDGSNLPIWLFFNPITRTFSCSPNTVSPGNYLIDLIVTDELGTSSVSSFNLGIQAPPNIDLSSNSTQDLLKNLAPLLGGSAMLVLITTMLISRQRRINGISLRIQEWANTKYLEVQAATEIIQFPDLCRELYGIAYQLTEARHVNEIESSFFRFEQRLRVYYAQNGKHEPMTALFDLNFIEKLLTILERVFEIHPSQIDREKTHGISRLLHCFLAMTLSEHTGRGHKISEETKALYFSKLNKLIARVRTIQREDIEILYELQCAHEVLICITDTTTLSSLCQTSLSHILSPGALFQDLRKLSIEIPSSWYVLLLELRMKLPAAKTDIAILKQVQKLAATQKDWRFLYGMIPLLLDVIINSPSPEIRTQAINGTDQRCGHSELGLRQLLQSGGAWPLGPFNDWVMRQAKWELNQVGQDLGLAERSVLSCYFDSQRSSVMSRRSLVVTPLGRVLSSVPPISGESKTEDQQCVNPIWKARSAQTISSPDMEQAEP